MSEKVATVGSIGCRPLRLQLRTKREKRFTTPAVMAGLVPAIYVVPAHRPFAHSRLLTGEAFGATCEPNHVDGRDKPHMR